MEIKLSSTINKKLELTLSQYQSWKIDPPLLERPCLIKELDDGISNFNFLVGDTKKFVVRIDGINPKALGLNRHSEWILLHQVSSAGLAPTPRYFNPDLCSLVVDYLPPDGSPKESYQDTAIFLRNLHSLAPIKYRLDLHHRIESYEKQLSKNHRDIEKKIRPFSSEIKKYIESLRADKTPTALCHNDLTKNNRVYSGSTIWGIDWEYAAMGSPWFDIAVICSSDNFSRSQIEAFLSSYLNDSSRLDYAINKTLAYKVIYLYIEVLWHAIARKNAPDDSTLIKLEEAVLVNH